MRVLGVDPGTLRLGYAVIEIGGPPTRGLPGLHYVECGVIRAPDERDVGARLFAIACDLAEVIREFEPRAFAIEKAFHGKSAASALKLGQARGALILLAHQHRLPTFEYAPAQVKRAVVGHGAATKAAIAERMKLLFALSRAPASDAADALAIAACHALRRL
jgi:crossover junction endodeoxyribonuclease RuvC